MQTLVHVGLANAVLAAALALLVIGIMRIHYNPFAARALWLVVLARFVMPPVLNVPLPVPTITLDRPDFQSQHRGPSEAATENPHRFNLPFNGIEKNTHRRFIRRSKAKV